MHLKESSLAEDKSIREKRAILEKQDGENSSNAQQLPLSFQRSRL